MRRALWCEGERASAVGERLWASPASERAGRLAILSRGDPCATDGGRC